MGTTSSCANVWAGAHDPFIEKQKIWQHDFPLPSIKKWLIVLLFMLLLFTFGTGRSCLAAGTLLPKALTTTMSAEKQEERREWEMSGILLNILNTHLSHTRLCCLITQGFTAFKNTQTACLARIC